MEKILIKQYKKPRLTNSILIGGLPGIGNIGKIAADYIIEKLKMQKLAEIFSQYLPPQVFVTENGMVYLARNTLYYKKIPGKRDLLILVGDFQGTTQEGQYEMSYNVLELLRKFDLSFVYTLGGYSTGKIVETPRVLGAVTDNSILGNLKENGVVFPKGEPGGGIVGSAGILLGLAKELFDIDGACLMGETSGYFADPRGAMEVLKVLSGILGFTIDLAEIEERSKQIEQITGRMQEDLQNKASKKEDLGYFG
ncbi:MAG: proteasome assembly chaperone family protein [Candidatus Thermoplasmatota archaeon]|nr:proteasome assembly chaperone family protein [Candidatus Thermoplasmatota archaeon]